jgi:hypothetical protein
MNNIAIMECHNKIWKPYLLSAIYCKYKNELISNENCLKCKKVGK